MTCARHCPGMRMPSSPRHRSCETSRITSPRSVSSSSISRNLRQCLILSNVPWLPPAHDRRRRRGAMTTVAIVDDDLLVCEHMQERLDRSEDMRCVGVAHAPGAARELVSRTRPDLIVLDIILADVRDPIELAEDLVTRSPRSRIVVCTTWSDNVKLDHEVEFRQKVRASNCGVISWVSKGRGINEVIEELRRAARWNAQPDGPSPLEQALGVYLRTTAASFVEGPLREVDAGLTPTEARIAT